MRWAGHVERVGEKRNAYRVWCGNLKKRGRSQHLGVDKRSILKGALKRNAIGGCGMNSSGSEYEQVGHCKHSKEPSGSIKCGKCPD
jgi:hypothetical protein